MSLAVEWVTRITAIGLLMFLPGVGANRLDLWLGTRFITPLGFGLGFVLGLTVLLVMVGAVAPKRRQ